MFPILARARNKLLGFTYQVTVTAGQTTTPKFTFAAGAPTAFVDYGDGSARDAVVSATELTHTYAAAGTYTVRLIAPNQQVYLTQVNISSDKVSQVLTPIQMFPKLTHFIAPSNTLWSQNIGGWSLPNLMVHFQINNSPVTGDISGWVLSAGITNLYLAVTSLSGNVSGWILPVGLVEITLNTTSMTGVISDWIIPASATWFQLNLTAITGCPVLSSMVSISTIRAENCALPQATVDLYLARCLAREADTTYANPVLNLGGTNAAPSAQGVTDHLALEAAGWVVTITA